MEVVLPLRAVAQPRPHHNPAGDCGACCLAGLFGLSVPEVYRRLKDGEVQGFSWPAMRGALMQAHHQGLADRVATAVPCWPVYEGHQTWGSPAWMQVAGWRERLCMALDAGYYGVAEVNHRREGFGSQPDHAVLLVGMRTTEVPLRGGLGTTYTTEVLVSCSASHPEGRWVEDTTFLREWGGFNLLLVRPASGDNP